MRYLERFVIWVCLASSLVERRKEMFYLTTHSTHYIYGYMASDIWYRTTQIVRTLHRWNSLLVVTSSAMKEGRTCLFNDVLNTFYLRLYGFRYMVKDYSDSERGNLLQPHGLLLPISSKGSFICIIPQTGLHIPRPLLHQPWSTWWNEK